MALGRDLRFAVRALSGAPIVTALAIACIGLGIGAVATVYSTASAFTFRPLPQFRDPGRVVLVAETPASDRSRGATVTAGTFADLRELRQFAAVGALVNWTANVAGFDSPERADAARVSSDFFRVTGRTAALGRTFSADDVLDGRRVVVLSHGLWRRRFGGDSGVIGATVRINGEGHQVIGVMPDDFVFPAGTQLWAPLVLSPRAAADRTARSLFVLARRAHGVSDQSAAAAVRSLGDRIAADHPDTHQGWLLRAEPAEEFFGAGPRPFMLVMLAAVVFLLLIACADVANLLLVRATARRREMGLRVALGATRGHLVIQLLTESMLLALAGGVAGVALARFGIAATAATVPLEVRQYIPGFGAITLDYRAMALAAAVSMLAGVAFGLMPALAGSAVDVNSALKDSGRSETRRSRLRAFRRALVVGEIALALTLVTGAALMATTFRRLARSDPGFRTSNVLTATITLPEADYPRDSTLVQFWDRFRESMAAEPGVSAAEVTSVLPMSWNDQRISLYPEGEKPDRPENAPVAGFRRVSPGYLGALGVPQRQGRPLSDADRSGTQPVAVLSESAARRLFPGRAAVGRRLVIGDQAATVIGIVGDVRANPLTSDSPTSVVYVPMSQWPSRTASVVLRVATGDPVAQVPALQRVVGRQDARLAAGELATMSRVVEVVTSPQSATAQVLLAAAFIALTLAAVGTYGVMAYAMARRTQEIGVRMALGATSRTIMRTALGDAARMAAMGVALGLLGAVALGRSMQAILVDTEPADPTILAGAASLLGAIALLAGWLPARRATRINAVTALRAD
jgi:predicted permease